MAGGKRRRHAADAAAAEAGRSLHGSFAAAANAVAALYSSAGGACKAAAAAGARGVVERQADWLLRAYGPSGAVPVPVLLDYLRAELSTTAEAADSPVDATLGFSVPQPLHLHAQAQLSQQQQPPPDDGMDAVPVVDVAAGKHPRPSPGGRRGGGGGGAFGV